jgi:hypothetical protein
MFLENQDIDFVIPEEVKERSKKSGIEWLLSFEDAKLVIDKSIEALIAILGVEVLEAYSDGIRTKGYSGYEFQNVKWEDFVEENNRAAMKFINANAHDDRYVYILTSASEKEFAVLGAKS